MNDRKKDERQSIDKLLSMGAYFRGTLLKTEYITIRIRSRLEGNLGPGYSRITSRQDLYEKKKRFFKPTLGVIAKQLGKVLIKRGLVAKNTE